MEILLYYLNMIVTSAGYGYPDNLVIITNPETFKTQLNDHVRRSSRNV